MVATQKNRIFIAAAGSGKTWLLVNEARARPTPRILITTYTENNAAEVERRFIEQCGSVPPNVTIAGWFEFLLEHCVRPYQGRVLDKRISGLNFNQGISAKGIAETDLRHYLDKSGQIYRDKVSKFACKCELLSGGRVTNRIAQVFDEIFIDEVQDISGYDLDLIELLMNSKAHLILVGDPRQGTYSTSDSQKYRKFKKAGIIQYFRGLAKRRKDVLLDETSLATNRRCHRGLCELSDELFPQFPRSKFLEESASDDGGVCLVPEADIDAYLAAMKPMQLRYRRTTPVSPSGPVMNFGQAKGLAFERTLIYPTKAFVDWLSDRSTELSDDVRAKSYVALTRARSSAGIVVEDGQGIRGLRIWNSGLRSEGAGKVVGESKGPVDGFPQTKRE